MEEPSEWESSAIYECMDDSDSEGDEYVTVSQPSPYTYMSPDPRTTSPPTDAATWDGPISLQAKKPKRRHQPLPPVDTTHLLAAEPGPHINPLPLPRKPGSGEAKQQEPKKPIVYKRLGKDASLPVKPKRPYKPGHLAKNSRPAPPPRFLPKLGQEYQPPSPSTPPPPSQPPPQIPPPSQRRDYPYHKLEGHGQTFSNDIPPPQNHPHHQQNSQASTDSEPPNEYESIKETRRMIAARRAYRERARTPPEPVARGGTGGGGAIQLGTISKKASDYDSQNEMTSSLEELVSSGDSGRSLVGQSKVVGILLSIAMVSVLIAVASLAPSLYSVTVIHTRRVSCAHEVRSNCAMNTGSPNQTTPLQLNNQILSGMYCEIRVLDDVTCTMTSALVSSLNGSYCVCSATCAEDEPEMECRMIVTECKYQ